MRKDWQRNLHFNKHIFVPWILSALLHGSVAWLVPSLTVGSRDVESPDFWAASTASFTVLVLLVNGRLWIMALNPLSPRTVTAMSLSFAMAYSTTFGLSETSLGHAMQPEMPGAAVRAFTEGRYLAVMAVTGLLMVLLDLFLIQGHRVLRPSLLDKARLRHRKSGSSKQHAAVGTETSEEGGHGP